MLEKFPRAKIENLFFLHFFQAESYIKLKEWKRAETLLQARLETHPEDLVAQYQLSQVFLEQKRPQRALATVQRAKNQACTCSLQPAKLGNGSCEKFKSLCVQILAQEADILRELGRYEEAIEVGSFLEMSLSYLRVR